MTIAEMISLYLGMGDALYRFIRRHNMEQTINKLNQAISELQEHLIKLKSDQSTLREFERAIKIYKVETLIEELKSALIKWENI